MSNLGSTFFVGVGHAYISGQSSYSALTNPVFDAILMTNNIGLQLFLTVSSFFWYLATILAVILFISRYLMAVAFDKVLPTRVSYVSERFHSPIVAHGIDLVVTLTALTIITLTPLSSSFLRRQYRRPHGDVLRVHTRGARRRLFGGEEQRHPKGEPDDHPRGSVADVIVLSVYAGYWVLYAPIYLGTVINPVSVGIIVSPFIGGVALYYGMRAYRMRREGIDLNNTFKEIPPE